MKAVSLVYIEKLIPIFKNGESANAIEVARVKTTEGNSIQYDIIVGKGLHSIGNKAIYIQPDYSIPQTPLFVEYHTPQGDPKKCRLGKKGRVRAIKFNFQFEGKTDPIYSNGILVPFYEFSKWFKGEFFESERFDELEDTIPYLQESGAMLDFTDYENIDFPYQEILGVEKYVADDNIDGKQPAGMTKRDFPSFMYKTDEETIQNHLDKVDACYENGEKIGFTQKRDGSSITEYYRIDPIEEVPEFGICSRKQEKKLKQEFVNTYKDGDVILHRYLHPETKVKGWYNDATKKFYTEEEAEQFEPIIKEVRDAWVDTDKKYGYLAKLTNYCELNNLQLVLRGELVGAGNKGSGNKLNSDARTEAKVIWFGLDDLSRGFAKRLNYSDVYNLATVCTELNLEYTKELFSGVFTYDEIIEKAHEYFAEIKEKFGIVVEGVVIRTLYSNNLSVKYINNEYDSKT